MNDFYNRDNSIFLRELDIASHFPDLKWRWKDDIPVLKGNYYFRTIYKNIEFKETFALKFEFPQNYPESPPTVKETENKIPVNFHHLANGTLCLCAPAELNMVFSKRPTLENYINNLLNPYLVCWLWYNKFGEMPWGERQHGGIGICESYAELLRIKNKMRLLPFLDKIIFNNIDQRDKCPCGTDIPYRNCHKKIVNNFLTKTPIQNIICDYMYIINDFRRFA